MAFFMVDSMPESDLPSLSSDLLSELVEEAIATTSPKLNVEVPEWLTEERFPYRILNFVDQGGMVLCGRRSGSPTGR